MTGELDRRTFSAALAALAAAPLATGETAMADTPSAARNAFGDIAPALADYTDEVLFGDVWQRPNLTPRDRSLVTISCLIALYRHNELPFHLKKGIDNGLTRD